MNKSTQALISMYGNLILANLATSCWLFAIFATLGLFNLGSYIYLSSKE